MPLCRLIFISCRCLKYPGVHLICHSGTVVYLIIDLRIQLGFVHGKTQPVIVHSRRNVVIACDFNGIFGFHGFFAFCRITVFQGPAFFKCLNLVRIGRYFACQGFQLEYVYGVIVVDTACHIDDTTIVRCDVRISYFIIRTAYGYNACSGFDCFVAKICFSVYRFFGKGVASDSDTVFIISTCTGSEGYAAFFVHNGIGAESRCEFRTGIRPMTDRCRFFVKCTCLHAQSRAVMSSGNRCHADRRCIAVVRLSRCAQCGRLITVCACFEADCNRFFLCAFIFTRLGIIVNRFIRVRRFPFIRRFRHGRCVARFCRADMGRVADGNSETARSAYFTDRTDGNAPFP